MKKLFTLLLIVIISIFIGAIYGILHDQITYSISPEYYTKFKFSQFGLTEDGASEQNPRLLAAVVGIMATWWMGIIIGFILGLVALIHKNWQKMFIVTIKAIFVTITIAFSTGLIGLLYGYISSENQSEPSIVYNHYIIGTVTDVKSFEMVGAMHNFSYIGGVLGMITSVVYIINQKVKFTQIQRQSITVK
jgi:hypothetical protein